MTRAHSGIERLIYDTYDFILGGRGGQPKDVGIQPDPRWVPQREEDRALIADPHHLREESVTSRAAHLDDLIALMARLVERRRDPP